MEVRATPSVDKRPSWDLSPGKLDELEEKVCSDAARFR